MSLHGTAVSEISNKEFSNVLRCDCSSCELLAFKIVKMANVFLQKYALEKHCIATECSRFIPEALVGGRALVEAKEFQGLLELLRQPVLVIQFLFEASDSQPE